jgi:hypothetical protein
LRRSVRGHAGRCAGYSCDRGSVAARESWPSPWDSYRRHFPGLMLIWNPIGGLIFTRDSYSLRPQYRLASILGALIRNSPRCHTHGPMLGPIPVPELLRSDDLTHAGTLASNPTRGRHRRASRRCIAGGLLPADHHSRCAMTWPDAARMERTTACALRRAARITTQSMSCGLLGFFGG